MEEYNHKEIEKKWQEIWEQDDAYKTNDNVEGKKNLFLLTEFPYPSGDLHVGHWYAFALPDIYARAKRMMGYNVLYPIGFDAFGLPAENAAIKRGLNPRQWTESNMETMSIQIRAMGTSFDWSRKVSTIDPNYYKWTQWLFLQLFKKGLVYQKETPANWCPSCKTVLANEQVIGNLCERCDSEVEKKKMLQWNIKITDYADRLLEDLNELDWPEEIKTSQRNWIGKSEGAEIPFKIKIKNVGTSDVPTFEVGVFTTRPDTLFGATYMVLAPEHNLVEKWLQDGIIENQQEVEEYIKEVRKKSDIDRTDAKKEKTGVKIKGVVAINPARERAGMTNTEIPVFIADYVLASYGTGAVMAVPAHDERDFEFAKKFDLEIVCVVSSNCNTAEQAYTGKGKLVNSGKFDGMDNENAKSAITEFVGGQMKSTYKLRDWGVSRQRYWGTPIPIIHCSECGAVPVLGKDLPVVLPEIEDYMPREDGKSPLSKVGDWVNVKCPKCKKDAQRETDTLDTFIDSSWYYIRYTDINNKNEFASKEKQEAWLPVDVYSGGAEHTTMHLLYSRFWHKALYDLGLVNDKEPYKKRMNRGIILGPDGNKMSKSKGNVINPDDVVERLGADTVRMYLAFIGPYNEVGHYPWNPDGVVGVRKFLERVWKIGIELQNNSGVESSARVQRELNVLIKKASEDIEDFKFNTTIAKMMGFLNIIKEEGGISKRDFSTFLQVLSPFAPHISEELWELFGNKEYIYKQTWPNYDEELLRADTITIAIQVNGKIRGEIEVPTDIDKQDVINLSKEKVQRWIDEKEIHKEIFVPGKLVSIVTN